MNGHRWSKFWWADHHGDAALRACSLAARGYWMELLCIAHEAAPPGHVLINGKQPTHRQLAAIAGCTERDAKRLEAELEEAGVFSRTTEGIIWSRRMVKDAAMSQEGREHVARRWNGAKTPDPPNRGANRGPTSEPYSQAYRDPISFPPDPLSSQKQSTEAETEPPLPPTGRGGRSHRSISPKPFKTGAFGLIAEEGSSNVTPINRFIALANVPRRAAR